MSDAQCPINCGAVGGGRGKDGAYDKELTDVIFSGGWPTAAGSFVGLKPIRLLS